MNQKNYIQIHPGIVEMAEIHPGDCCCCGEWTARLEDDMCQYCLKKYSTDEDDRACFPYLLEPHPNL